MKTFIVTLANLLLLISAGARTFPLQFAHTVYIIGGHPRAVAIADVNGDGKPDIITTNDLAHGAGSIAVLLGNGDGTFGRPVNTQMDSPAFFFVVGDFNGDGKLDFASPQYLGAAVAVRLGNGDGTFQPPTSFPVSGTTGQIVAMDFNRDGKLDIAVADGNANVVSVLLGNGDGSFQGPQDSAADVPYFLAAGDFNNDGKPDLIAGDGGIDPIIDVLLGNGDGTFQPAILLRSGQVPAIMLLAADVNGDGNLDIVYVWGPTRPTAILLGNGDGTFQHVIESTGFGTNHPSYAVADFFQDGKLDLISTGAPSPEVDLLFGRGDGHFDAGQVLAVTNHRAALTVAAADLNADHLPDIVVANAAGRLQVLLNQGP